MTGLPIMDWTALAPMANHLWQSTAFATVVALLALALRRNQARARYWLWTAASLKFLVPFALLIALGSRLDWRTAPSTMREAVSSAMEEVGAPFITPPVAPKIVKSPLPIALLALWATGCALVLIRWFVRWKRLARISRAASPMASGREWDSLQRVQAFPALCCRIRMACTDASLEPGVFGIFRPTLLVPAGIGELLSEGQLAALLAHELCHVRRRDNLAAAVHMVIEAIFWFHPLVWWIGARLVEERERACDEAVLRLGNDSRVYAESILRACEFYLQSPLACVSGVTGGELKKRIERIVQRRFAPKLGLGGKLLLTAAALSAVALPMFIGIADAPVARAQSPSSLETFETVSIKLEAPGKRGRGFITDPGRMRMINVSLRDCIQVAFGIQDFQIEAKDLSNERYNILATAPNHPSRALDARYEAMLQAMLADRFQLETHRESKVTPVFAMEAAKSGSKLKESSEVGFSSRSTRGHVKVTGATMLEWATYLSRRVGRPVVDMTGLKGIYDFTLDWEPSEGEASVEPPPDPDKPQLSDSSAGPSIFTAMQEQLGLKLTSKKLPVEIVVVDHVAKPSAN